MSNVVSLRGAAHSHPELLVYLVVAALYLVLIVAFKLALAALGRLLFRAPNAAQTNRRGA